MGFIKPLPSRLRNLWKRVDRKIVEARAERWLQEKSIFQMQTKQKSQHWEDDAVVRILEFCFLSKSQKYYGSVFFLLISGVGYRALSDDIHSCRRFGSCSGRAMICASCRWYNPGNSWERINNRHEKLWRIERALRRRGRGCSSCWFLLLLLLVVKRKEARRKRLRYLDKMEIELAQATQCPSSEEVV